MRERPLLRPWERGNRRRWRLAARAFTALALVLATLWAWSGWYTAEVKWIGPGRGREHTYGIDSGRVCAEWIDDRLADQLEKLPNLHWQKIETLHANAHPGLPWEWESTSTTFGAGRDEYKVALLPFITFSSISAGLCAAMSRRPARAARPDGRCLTCGYDVSKAAATNAVCPECGQRP